MSRWMQLVDPVGPEDRSAFVALGFRFTKHNPFRCYRFVHLGRHVQAEAEVPGFRSEWRSVRRVRARRFA